MADDSGYPMPGNVTFSADEEQRMRAGNASQLNRPTGSSQDVPVHGGILNETGPSGAAAMRRQSQTSQEE